MNLELSEGQRALRDEAAAFARRELNGGLVERDRRSEFSAEAWKQCATFGILRMPMPSQYGGDSLDLPTIVARLDGLGYGCRDNGLLFGLGAQLWSVQIPVLRFGSEEQKARYLPRMMEGEIIGAHSVTEPTAGSDAFSMKTTATRVGDTYVLRGKKTYITNAPVADLFLVLANVDPARGPRGVTAFLLEKNTPGLSVRPLDKMGLRTIPMGEIEFADCAVSAQQLLGKEGDGPAVFSTAMEWERCFIMAPVLGTMQRQLDTCLHYAHSRSQFGQPIARNETVANKIVDMQIRLDLARLLSWHVAQLKQAGKRLRREPSEVKLYTSESWVQTSQDALQLHGALGYLTETGIERDLRDALASKIYSGTSEIQRRLIASYLGV